MCRLALGTAQFGLAYGITNTEGQVSEEGVGDILQLASQYGISLLDTAAAYGQSEEVLSRLKAEHNFQLVSKTLPLTGQAGSVVKTIEGMTRSLQWLATEQVLYGMLIHHPNDLLGPDGKMVYTELQKMRDVGRVQKIGVSVYTEEEIEASCLHYKIDIIQLPHNVLDQRLRMSGRLNKLRDLGIEVCVRSAFLQGLLLQEPELLPLHLHRLSSPLMHFFARARELACSPLTLALGYLRQQKTIDQVVVGVLNTQQLQEICHAWGLADDLPKGCADDLGVEDDMLLNPAKWGKLTGVM